MEKLFTSYENDESYVVVEKEKEEIEDEDK